MKRAEPDILAGVELLTRRMAKLAGSENPDWKEFGRLSRQWNKLVNRAKRRLDKQFPITGTDLEPAWLVEYAGGEEALAGMDDAQRREYLEDLEYEKADWDALAAMTDEELLADFDRQPEAASYGWLCRECRIKVVRWEYLMDCTELCPACIDSWRGAVVPFGRPAPVAKETTKLPWLI